MWQGHVIFTYSIPPDVLILYFSLSLQDLLAVCPVISKVHNMVAGNMLLPHAPSCVLN